MKRVVSILGLVALVTAQSMACGIEGSAVRTDGSKVDGTAKVSTSWNSNVAYPRGGSYSLDLGSSVCGKRVTVYVNGYDIGRYRIPSRGYARVNIMLKGTSDVPVR